MEITIEWERGYYVIKINGRFYCSCDTMKEVGEEVRDIVRERQRMVQDCVW